MSLVSYANAIYDLLVARPTAEWALTINTNFPFRRSLDPLSDIERNIQGTFVVPIVNNYNIDLSNKGRGTQPTLQLVTYPRIAVVIARPFTTNDPSGIDVSSWSEVENILNFREQVDVYIAKNIPRISAIDSEPPIETTYEKRWYLSVTEIMFDEIQC